MGRGQPAVGRAGRASTVTAGLARRACRGCAWWGGERERGVGVWPVRAAMGGLVRHGLEKSGPVGRAAEPGGGGAVRGAGYHRLGAPHLPPPPRQPAWRVIPPALAAPRSQRKSRSGARHHGYHRAGAPRFEGERAGEVGMRGGWGGCGAWGRCAARQPHRCWWRWQGRMAERVGAEPVCSAIRGFGRGGLGEMCLPGGGAIRRCSGAESSAGCQSGDACRTASAAAAAPPPGRGRARRAPATAGG